MAASTGTAAAKQLSRLDPQRTVFFLCDIQEKFRAVIHNFPSVVHVASLLARSAPILDVPLIATEQYPAALGKIVEEIPLSTQTIIIEKTLFSMATPEVRGWLQAHPERTHVVLFGIEAHVCIQQTALDLRSMGLAVHLAVDGISSRRPMDRHASLQRMKDVCSVITTSESILFELIRDANHPQFKQISALVKERRPPEHPWFPHSQDQAA